MLTPETNNGPRIHRLDSLRGVSILMVMASHAFGDNLAVQFPSITPLISGSFGVVIFFVLSGFIITSLLQNEYALTGRIDAKKFWLKRISKLAAPLWTYLAVLYCCKVFMGSHSGCTQEAWVSAASYTTELLQAFGDKGCWALGHTWSLSVEEIFYLFWPVALFFLEGTRATALLIAFVAFAPVVRTFNYVVSANKFNTNLHLIIPLFSHLDSIAVGCLTAFVLRKSKDSKLLHWRHNSQALALLAFITYIMSLPHFKMPLLSGLKFIALPFTSSIQALFTALILVTMCRGNRPSDASSRSCVGVLLQKLGRASYSMYVWQQVILNPYSGLMVTVFDGVLGIALSIGVGFISFYMIEQPIQLWLRRLLNLDTSVLAVPVLQEEVSKHQTMKEAS